MKTRDTMQYSLYRCTRLLLLNPPSMSSDSCCRQLHSMLQHLPIPFVLIHSTPSRLCKTGKLPYRSSLFSDGPSSHSVLSP